MSGATEAPTSDLNDFSWINRKFCKRKSKGVNEPQMGSKLGSGYRINYFQALGGASVRRSY